MDRRMPCHIHTLSPGLPHQPLRRTFQSLTSTPTTTMPGTRIDMHTMVQGVEDLATHTSAQHPAPHSADVVYLRRYRARVPIALEPRIHLSSLYCLGYGMPCHPLVATLPRPRHLRQHQPRPLRIAPTRKAKGLFSIITLSQHVALIIAI